MKIQSGIKAIGNIESALEEHFLISCEMSQITEAFLESLHFNSDKINNWLGELTRELRTMLESWKK